MKKIVSIILCFVFIFGLAACGKEKVSNNSNIDLEYYAKLGKMPETDFTLGDDIDEVIKKLTDKQEQFDNEHEEDLDHSHDHNQADFIFNVTEGKKNVLIDNGAINYYYNKDNKKNGISFIVNYDTAFEFEIGTLISEVEENLTGYELTEEEPNEEEIFFVSYITDASVLKTRINDVAIIFVFQENMLFATAMYDTNNWNF